MTRIHLYNHAEDAWEANLATWLEQRSRESFSGHEAWLVTGSYFQANWIRRMALSQNKALFGIQFFDRRALRQHLCHLYGLPGPSFGRETLQILLDAAAGKDNAEYAATRSLLYALDELGASGCLDEIGLEETFSILKVPDRLQRAVRELTASAHWSPRVDSILLERVTQRNGSHLGLFGLDAESFGDLNLFLAAVKRASRSDLWIAQPLGKEELMFQWITTLERMLNASAVVCPTGGAPRPYETFLGHWQSGGERKVRPPEVLVADSWYGQVEAIVHRVAKALTEKTQSVLVVVPENSATGSAVVHTLISNGIAVADEVRETKLIPLALELQTAISQYLSEDRTPECFLRIVQCLLRSQGDFFAFRNSFLRSFEDRQTRLVSALITERHRDRFPWIRDLESALELWPEEADWAEFHRRWETLLLRLSTITKANRAQLVQVTFSTGQTEPLWHEIKTLMQGHLSTSKIFLKLVTQLFAAQPREPHPAAHHRYAKVSVATSAKAYGTSWDCVILADSISDRWPVAPLPNPVLNDEEKIRLRQRGFFILTSAELRQIQEERFLQLAYHARTDLILARYEQDEKGLEAVANNLSTFSEEFLKAAVTRFEARPKLVRDDLTTRFKEICADRLDRNKPFDDYFLNFKLLPRPTRAWHPSELENVFKTPGTFAFNLIFGCRREFDRGFVRSAPMTVGRVAHRLLQQSFAGAGQFQAFAQTANWSREEARVLFLNQMNLASQKMRAELMAYGPDLWWETILGKATAFASRMLENVSALFEANLWYQSEGVLKGTYSSLAGGLELEGRTDLILSDRNSIDSAALSICDFKTSKQARKFNSETGDSLQFLGYRLLAQANKALEIKMLIVKPDGIKPLSLPPDEELLALLELLTRLQRDRSFGRRPTDRWEVSEKLPIATLPIDGAILESKLELTWK